MRRIVKGQMMNVLLNVRIFLVKVEEQTRDSHIVIVGFDV